MRDVEPSPTLDITSLAKKMMKEGKNVINFAAGEPDFDTPEPIKKIAKEAIDEGFTKYTPSSGTEELKDIICAKFKRDNRLNYTQNQIIVSCGAKHSLYNVFQVLCNPADEVVLIAPYWVSYPEMIKIVGAKPVIVKAKESDNFRVHASALKKAITKKTKAIVLNSPSNPAGVIYSLKELEEIAEIAVANKIFVISDEIYEKLIYDQKKHISIGSLGSDIYKQTITVNGVSKSYSMTGWRIGYLGADPLITKGISILQSHSTSNPTSISQKAALGALELPKKAIDEMCAEFEKRRNCMIKRLDEIPALMYTKPSGAFYVFCNIQKTGLKAKEFARNLLKEKLVAVIPGEAFGFDGYVRLSFATNLEKINEGINRMKQWLKQ